MVFNQRERSMTFLLRCCCYAAILMTVPTCIFTYNFDLDNVIVYDNAVEHGLGTRESYSGFSVALWKSRTKKFENSWLYIGSPRANSSAYKNVNEPGTVWKCQIGKPCKEWVMNMASMDEQPVAGSWLGGTMAIENRTTDTNIVVCGPRWVDKHKWMLGKCYRAHARELAGPDPEERASVSSLDFGTRYSKQMTEAGFSAHFVRSNDVSRHIVFGCPGYGYYGQGIPIQYSIDDTESTIFPQLSTLVRYYDYLGYAVTSGFYFDRHVVTHAAGAPRSENLKGKVMLFDFSPLAKESIIVSTSVIGATAGEYFGSALASCDINGDEFDDLIVGAPQWTKDVDEGRVYIYKGNIQKDLTNPQILEGEKPRGRFGTAITCLGDIDHDGYADFAVGAPYEGHGVVYIYHGGEERVTLTQIIPGSENTAGFGISISQPRDIDDNGYADIAVGAYLSGHVTLFRSKLPVTTEVALISEFNSTNPLPTNSTAFDLKVCSSYSGKHPPKTLEVTVELKIDEISQRAETKVDGKALRTYVFDRTLTQDSSSKCLPIKIDITHEQLIDYLKPLKFLVIQRLRTTNSPKGIWRVDRSGGSSGKDHFNSASTVSRSQSECPLEIPFLVMCHNGKRICIPRLKIDMSNNLKNNNKYVIGSHPYIMINISISNTGDRAFLPEVILEFPSIILRGQLPQQFNCRQPEPSQTTGTRQIECKFGNLLEENESIMLSLDLDLSLVDSTLPAIRLNATTTAQNQNVTSGDHKAEMVIDCETRTDIGIKRKTTMDRYTYTLKTEDQQLPSIRFQHIYDIRNYEVTLITGALFSVSIPTHLIYAGNEIEIIRHNKTQGVLEGQEIFCNDAENDKTYYSTSYDATTNTEWVNKSGSTSDKTFEVIDRKVYVSSPNNRTLHINCTNPSIKWKTVNCKLNKFKELRSVARFAFTFDLLLANFTPAIIEEKDIIFFATNGSVRTVGQPGETIYNEPNLIMIGTIFVEIPKDNGLPGWVIPVAIIVGLLLLALLVLALFKFGFFKRNKQMELRALLKENDNKPTGTVAEDANYD